MNNIKLESKRLFLNKMNESYIDDTYLDWLNDPMLHKYTFVNQDYTKEKLKNFVKGVEDRNALFYAIHLKENNIHIGNVKVEIISKYHRLGEFGILMGNKDYYGKGYAKEASELLINHCFDEIKLNKISLHVAASHSKAISLYESLGFLKEGLLKRHFHYKFGYDDVLLMSILNETNS